MHHRRADSQTPTAGGAGVPSRCETWAAFLRLKEISSNSSKIIPSPGLFDSANCSPLFLKFQLPAKPFQQALLRLWEGRTSPASPPWSLAAPGGDGFQMFAAVTC